MRYTIWGPVLGLAIAAVIVNLGSFGINLNAYLATGGILIAVGLGIGLLIDYKK